MSSPKDAGAYHEDSGASSNMQPGDVLAACPNSTIEHDISIVPEKPHATVATRREGVERAAEEAEVLGVDAWVTDDRIHVVKVSRNRPKEGHKSPGRHTMPLMPNSPSRGLDPVSWTG